MELKKNKVSADELLSLREFAEKKELPHMSNETIQYRISKDELDFVTIGRDRFIVWNTKAEEIKFNIRPEKERIHRETF